MSALSPCVDGSELARTFLNVQFHRSARHLPAGWAPTWDRPLRFVQNSCWWRERKQFFRFLPSGPRLFESSQQRGAAARSRAVVSANGGLFECEPAGRGCGIFLGAVEGIRLSPHGSSKSVLSERRDALDRIATGTERLVQRHRQRLSDHFLNFGVRV